MKNLWKEQKLCRFCGIAMMERTYHGAINVDLGGTYIEVVMPTTLCCGDCTHHVFPFNDIKTLKQKVEKFSRKKKEIGICSVSLDQIDELVYLKR